MVQVELEIVNKLGLHARASAKLTQMASKFKSEVWIMRNNKRVNGKSIMGVMMLAASKGAIVQITAAGDDETDAINQIEALIQGRFGESC